MAKKCPDSSPVAGCQTIRDADASSKSIGNGNGARSPRRRRKDQRRSSENAAVESGVKDDVKRKS